jgi:hypothetical protein
MTKKEFILKEEHLKLLKEAYVGWYDCEYGAPCIDPKRPYGNSDVERDIAEILNWKIDDEYDELSKSQLKEVENLHAETEIALQIVLQHIGEIPLLGKYTCDDYLNWKYAK